MRKFELFQDYLYYAERAVVEEKQGNYADAVELWKEAALAAKQRENKTWAKHREKSCKYWLKRPSLAPVCYAEYRAEKELKNVQRAR